MTDDAVHLTRGFEEEALPALCRAMDAAVADILVLASCSVTTRSAPNAGTSTASTTPPSSLGTLLQRICSAGAGSEELLDVEGCADFSHTTFHTSAVRALIRFYTSADISADASPQEVVHTGVLHFRLKQEVVTRLVCMRQALARVAEAVVSPHVLSPSSSAPLQDIALRLSSGIGVERCEAGLRQCLVEHEWPLLHRLACGGPAGLAGDGFGSSPKAASAPLKGGGFLAHLQPPSLAAPPAKRSTKVLVSLSSARSTISAGSSATVSPVATADVKEKTPLRNSSSQRPSHHPDRPAEALKSLEALSAAAGADAQTIQKQLLGLAFLVGDVMLKVCITEAITAGPTGLGADGHTQEGFCSLPAQEDDPVGIAFERLCRLCSADPAYDVEVMLGRSRWSWDIAMPSIPSLSVGAGATLTPADSAPRAITRDQDCAGPPPEELLLHTQRFLLNNILIATPSLRTVSGLLACGPSLTNYLLNWTVDHLAAVDEPPCPLSALITALSRSGAAPSTNTATPTVATLSDGLHTIRSALDSCREASLRVSMRTLQQLAHVDRRTFEASFAASLLAEPLSLLSTHKKTALHVQLFEEGAEKERIHGEIAAFLGRLFGLSPSRTFTTHAPSHQAADHAANGGLLSQVLLPVIPNAFVLVTKHLADLRIATETAAAIKVPVFNKMAATIAPQRAFAAAELITARILLPLSSIALHSGKENNSAILALLKELGAIATTTKEARGLFCRVLGAVGMPLPRYRGFAAVVEPVRVVLQNMYEGCVKEWMGKAKYAPFALPCAAAVVCLLSRETFINECPRLITSLLRAATDHSEFERHTRAIFVAAATHILGFYCTFILHRTTSSAGSAVGRHTLETAARSMLQQVRDFCIISLRKTPTLLPKATDPPLDGDAQAAPCMTVAVADLILALCASKPVAFGFPLLLDLLPQDHHAVLSEASAAALVALRVLTQLGVHHSPKMASPAAHVVEGRRVSTWLHAPLPSAAFHWSDGFVFLKSCGVMSPTVRRVAAASVRQGSGLLLLSPFAPLAAADGVITLAHTGIASFPALFEICRPHQTKLPVDASADDTLFSSFQRLVKDARPFTILTVDAQSSLRDILIHARQWQDFEQRHPSRRPRSEGRPAPSASKTKTLAAEDSSHSLAMTPLPFMETFVSTLSGVFMHAQHGPETAIEEPRNGSFGGFRSAAGGSGGSVVSSSCTRPMLAYQQVCRALTVSILAAERDALCEGLLAPAMHNPIAQLRSFGGIALGTPAAEKKGAVDRRKGGSAKDRVISRLKATFLTSVDTDNGRSTGSACAVAFRVFMDSVFCSAFWDPVLLLHTTTTTTSAASGGNHAATQPTKYAGGTIDNSSMTSAQGAASLEDPPGHTVKSGALGPALGDVPLIVRCCFHMCADVVDFAWNFCLPTILFYDDCFPTRVDYCVRQGSEASALHEFVSDVDMALKRAMATGPSSSRWPLAAADECAAEVLSPSTMRWFIEESKHMIHYVRCGHLNGVGPVTTAGTSGSADSKWVWSHYGGSFAHVCMSRFADACLVLQSHHEILRRPSDGIPVEAPLASVAWLRSTIEVVLGAVNLLCEISDTDAWSPSSDSLSIHPPADFGKLNIWVPPLTVATVAQEVLRGGSSGLAAPQPPASARTHQRSATGTSSHGGTVAPPGLSCLDISPPMHRLRFQNEHTLRAPLLDVLHATAVQLLCHGSPAVRLSAFQLAEALHHVAPSLRHESAAADALLLRMRREHVAMASMLSTARALIRFSSSSKRGGKALQERSAPMTARRRRDAEPTVSVLTSEASFSSNAGDQRAHHANNSNADSGGFIPRLNLGSVRGSGNWNPVSRAGSSGTLISTSREESQTMSCFSDHRSLLLAVCRIQQAVLRSVIFSDASLWEIIVLHGGALVQASSDDLLRLSRYAALWGADPEHSDTLAGAPDGYPSNTYSPKDTAKLCFAGTWPLRAPVINAQGPDSNLFQYAWHRAALDQIKKSQDPEHSRWLDEDENQQHRDLFLEALVGTWRPVVLVAATLKRWLPTSSPQMSQALPRLCSAVYRGGIASGTMQTEPSLGKYLSPAQTAELVSLDSVGSVDTWVSQLVLAVTTDALCVHSEAKLQRAVQNIERDTEWSALVSAVLLFEASALWERRTGDRGGGPGTFSPRTPRALLSVADGRVSEEGESSEEDHASLPESPVFQLRLFAVDANDDAALEHHRRTRTFVARDILSHAVHILSKAPAVQDVYDAIIVVMDTILSSTNTNLLCVPHPEMADVLLAFAQEIDDRLMASAAKKDPRRFVSLSGIATRALHCAYRLVMVPTVACPPPQWAALQLRDPSDERSNTRQKCRSVSLDSTSPMSTRRLSTSRVPQLSTSRAQATTARAVHRSPALDPLPSARHDSGSTTVSKPLPVALRSTSVFLGVTNPSLQLVKFFDVFDGLFQRLLRASSSGGGSKQPSQAPLRNIEKNRNCGLSSGCLLPALPPWSATRGRVCDAFQDWAGGQLGEPVPWAWSEAVHVREALMALLADLAFCSLSVSEQPADVRYPAFTQPCSHYSVHDVIGHLPILTRYVYPEAASEAARAACHELLRARQSVYFDWCVQHMLYLGSACTVFFGRSVRRCEGAWLETKFPPAACEENRSMALFALSLRVMTGLSTLLNLQVASEELQTTAMASQLQRFYAAIAAAASEVAPAAAKDRPGFSPPPPMATALASLLSASGSRYEAFGSVLVYVLDRSLAWTTTAAAEAGKSLLARSTFEETTTAEAALMLSPTAVPQCPQPVTCVALPTTSLPPLTAFMGTLMLHCPLYLEPLLSRMTRESSDAFLMGSVCAPSWLALYHLCVVGTLQYPLLLLDRPAVAPTGAAAAPSALSSIGAAGWGHAAPQWPSADTFRVLHHRSRIRPLVLQALLSVGSAGVVLPRPGLQYLISPDLVCASRQLLSMLASCAHNTTSAVTTADQHLRRSTQCTSTDAEMKYWLEVLFLAESSPASRRVSSYRPDRGLFQYIWTYSSGLLLSAAKGDRIPHRLLRCLMVLVTTVPRYFCGVAEPDTLRTMLQVDELVSTTPQLRALSPLAVQMWRHLEENECPRTAINIHTHGIARAAGDANGRFKIITRTTSQLVMLLICGVRDLRIGTTRTDTAAGGDRLNVHDAIAVLSRLKSARHLSNRAVPRDPSLEGSQQISFSMSQTPSVPSEPSGFYSDVPDAAESQLCELLSLLASPLKGSPSPHAPAASSAPLHIEGSSPPLPHHHPKSVPFENASLVYGVVRMALEVLRASSWLCGQQRELAKITLPPQDLLSRLREISAEYNPSHAILLLLTINEHYNAQSGADGSVSLYLSQFDLHQRCVALLGAGMQILTEDDACLRQLAEDHMFCRWDYFIQHVALPQGTSKVEAGDASCVGGDRHFNDQSLHFAVYRQAAVAVRRRQLANQEEERQKMELQQKKTVSVKSINAQRRKSVSSVYSASSFAPVPKGGKGEARRPYVANETGTMRTYLPPPGGDVHDLISEDLATAIMSQRTMVSSRDGVAPSPVPSDNASTSTVVVTHNPLTQEAPQWGVLLQPSAERRRRKTKELSHRSTAPAETSMPSSPMLDPRSSPVHDSSEQEELEDSPEGVTRSVLGRRLPRPPALANVSLEELTPSINPTNTFMTAPSLEELQRCLTPIDWAVVAVECLQDIADEVIARCAFVACNLKQTGDDSLRSDTLWKTLLVSIVDSWRLPALFGLTFLQQFRHRAPRTSQELWSGQTPVSGATESPLRFEGFAGAREKGGWFDECIDRLRSRLSGHHHHLCALTQKVQLPAANTHDDLLLWLAAHGSRDFALQTAIGMCTFVADAARGAASHKAARATKDLAPTATCFSNGMLYILSTLQSKSDDTGPSIGEIAACAPHLLGASSTLCGVLAFEWRHCQQRDAKSQVVANPPTALRLGRAIHALGAMRLFAERLVPWSTALPPQPTPASVSAAQWILWAHAVLSVNATAAGAEGPVVLPHIPGDMIPSIFVPAIPPTDPQTTSNDNDTFLSCSQVCKATDWGSLFVFFYSLRFQEGEVDAPHPGEVAQSGGRDNVSPLSVLATLVCSSPSSVTFEAQASAQPVEALDRSSALTTLVVFPLLFLANAQLQNRAAPPWLRIASMKARSALLHIAAGAGTDHQIPVINKTIYRDLHKEYLRFQRPILAILFPNDENALVPIPVFELDVREAPSSLMCGDELALRQSVRRLEQVVRSKHKLLLSTGDEDDVRAFQSSWGALFGVALGFATSTIPSSQVKQSFVVNVAFELLGSSARALIDADDAPVPEQWISLSPKKVATDLALVSNDVDDDFDYFSQRSTDDDPSSSSFTKRKRTKRLVRPCFTYMCAKDDDTVTVFM